MSSQQFHRQEENRDYNMPPQQADGASATAQRGPGTDVMGEPVNPLSDSSQAHTNLATDSGEASAYPPSAGSRGPPVSPMYDSQTPADANSYSRTPTGNFPSAQMPQSLSSAGNDQYPAESQQRTAQTTNHSPYVQTTSVPGSTGKTPMDSIMSVFNKWSKKAEDMTGNYWAHLKTGPNVADTAMGRIALGTRAISEGGLENVYRQTFDVAPEEHLLKTYACYLSTSTGPVAGTLYISTQKLAFCSDRPLAIPQTPGQNDQPPIASDASTPTGKKSSAQQQQQQQQQQQHQYCYYKVMIPIGQVESVNPSENTQKKPPEKYVQVKTSDGHEFWFMGFVNYDKGVKNLQEAVSSNRTTSPTDHTSVYADANATTNQTSYGNTDPNSTSYGNTNPTSTSGGNTYPPKNASAYGNAMPANSTTEPGAYGDRSYGDNKPTTNPGSYDGSSYGADTRHATGPPAYGDRSYGDNRPTTNPGSYDGSSYGADTRHVTGPPAYDEANTTTNHPSDIHTTHATSPPAYDDVTTTTNHPSEVPHA